MHRLNIENNAKKQASSKVSRKPTKREPEIIPSLHSKDPKSTKAMGLNIEEEVVGDDLLVIGRNQQEKIDDIIKVLYSGTGSSASSEIQTLLEIALDKPDKQWVVEESTMELLLIWYPNLPPSVQASLLRFMCLAFGTNAAIDKTSLLRLVKENIQRFRPPSEADRGQHSCLDLLVASVELGASISHEAEMFLGEIQENILSCLSPFMKHSEGRDWAFDILDGLKSHLVKHRELYATEAVPLLVAGIDEDVRQMETRGELLAMLVTDSTAEMVVDCLGGLTFLLNTIHIEGSIKAIKTLALRLEQLPDSENLLTVLSGLLCSQIQLLIDTDSKSSCLDNGIRVMYQVLVRGSAPLVLSATVHGQLSDLLIQLGNHGHHVKFLQRESPEAITFYLSLVGRYANNDPSLPAHLEQLLAAGGLEIIVQSDVLPLLGARFPQGPYLTLLNRYLDSTKEQLSSIKMQLFEALLEMGQDLLENKFDVSFKEVVPSNPPAYIHLALKLPALIYDFQLSPEAYPSPNPTQFSHLWNKYPIRYCESLWPVKGAKGTSSSSNVAPSNPDIRVSTVTMNSPSSGTKHPHQQWSGYTFETSCQVLILLIYQYRVNSDAPPELIIKSDSTIPACLLMNLVKFFRTLSAA